MSVRALILTALLGAALLAQETAKEPATHWPGYQASDYESDAIKITAARPNWI